MNHKVTPQQLALQLLGRDFDALDHGEQTLLEKLASSRMPMLDADEHIRTTLGARLADRVAAVGGSWGFIGAFALVLILWVLLNSPAMAALGFKPFDRYPFIFLNLMLSMLAAVQAPIIMMSQNRQAAKDRITARHDYEVNLRAQLEILRLSHKVDGLVAELRKQRANGGNANGK